MLILVFILDLDFFVLLGTALLFLGVEDGGHVLTFPSARPTARRAGLLSLRE